MSQRFGSRDRLDAQVKLIGSIKFPFAIDLDAATSACWDWRRYFNQMTLGVLRFTGMSVAANNDEAAKRGNLYLPFEASKQLVDDGRQPGTDPFYMPLNQWEQREQAGVAMQEWLAKQSERLVFRAALDRVLARPGHIATEDAVALCSGIDTLPELSSREALPGRTLSAMTAAAIHAASQEGVELEEQRVKGLLGSLQNDDLRRKLRRLADLAAPETSREEVEHWINIVLPLRTFGAHGRRSVDDQDIVAGSAVDTLAALCVRYDQQTSGVPDQCVNGSSSLAKVRWREALNELSAF